MFAERRPEPAHGRWTGGEPRRYGRHGHIPIEWMLHPLEEPRLLKILVLQQVLQRVDRSARNIERPQYRQPLRRGALAHTFGEHSVQRIDVVRPCRDRRETRILDQRRSAHRLEQPAPVCVAHRDHRDVAILRRVWPPMRRQHARIAEAEFRLIEHRAPQMLDQQERQHRLEHRHMHFLALSGAFAVKQRHADHRRQHLAGQLVHHDARHVTRRAIRSGIQRGKSAHSLDHVVKRGMVLLAASFAESRRAGIDEALVALRELGVAETQPFRGAEPHVVHEHIGAIDQPQQRVLCRRLLQVQHHAALVAVEHGEIGAHSPGAAWSDPAAVVAVRRFHLDHIGAHVAQLLRGEWPKHDRCQIDHANAGERAALHSSPPPHISPQCCCRRLRIGNGALRR